MALRSTGESCAAPPPAERRRTRCHVASMRLPVFDRRRAGALLPMSALEAALGRGGRACIDWLAEAGFSVWQILPTGPVGEDRSPYWVRSVCAVNPAIHDPAGSPAPDCSDDQGSM